MTPMTARADQMIDSDDIKLAIQRAVWDTAYRADDLVNALIEQVERLLRRKYALTYLQCDFLLGDLQCDLNLYADELLSEWEREFTFSLEYELLENSEDAPLVAS
jgi:hypothetical protein